MSENIDLHDANTRERFIVQKAEDQANKRFNTTPNSELHDCLSSCEVGSPKQLTVSKLVAIDNETRADIKALSEDTLITKDDSLLRQHNLIQDNETKFNSISEAMMAQLNETLNGLKQKLFTPQSALSPADILYWGTRR